MIKALEMKLLSKPLYNFYFFGTQREPDARRLNGHFAYITDGNEFVFYKLGDYGGFTWIRETKGADREFKLNDAEYRVVHDAILREQYGSHRNLELLYNLEVASNEVTNMWDMFKHYPLLDYRVSGNIQHGDEVINLLTNDVFTVDHTHDISYINRDFHYKLTKREVHPKPVTLKDFKAKLKSVNPFQDWTEVKSRRKDLNNFNGDYIINGEQWKLNSKYTDKGLDTYYITTPKDVIWSMESNISAPFYDALVIITGEIYSEIDYSDHRRYNYCIYECVNDVSRTKPFGDQLYQIPTRFRLFNEEASYRYNTRLTYL